MAGEINQTTPMPTTNGSPVQENAAPADPWAAAFAALEQNNKKDPEGDATAGSDNSASGGDQEQPGGQGEGTQPVSSGAAQSDQGSAASSDDQGSSASPENADGGPGADSGLDPGEDQSPAGAESFGFTEAELEDYRTAVADDIADRAIQYVNKAFIDQGVLNHDGIVGATIDNPKICRRDRDGVPHFFNPETGREFTGDNPRAQAQAYVDSYNRDLETKFNQACSQYSNQLAEQESPELAVLEFAPKYEKLDPIRQSMFDAIIEPYETKNDQGQVIGYNVDLDAALETVDKLVSVIQSHAPKPETVNGTVVEESRPALDMKNSVAVAQQQQGAPKSVEDALLMIQNKMLEDAKK